MSFTIQNLFENKYLVTSFYTYFNRKWWETEKAGYGYTLGRVWVRYGNIVINV